jgi:hypothetical protein
MPVPLPSSLVVKYGSKTLVQHISGAMPPPLSSTVDVDAIANAFGNKHDARRPLPGVKQRIFGVAEQVQYHLGKLTLDTPQLQIFVTLQRQFNRMVFEHALHDVCRCPDGLCQLERFGMFARLEEIAKLVNRGRHPRHQLPGFFLHPGHGLFGQGAHAVLHANVLHHQAQGVEGLTPLMGNGSDHFAHGRQAGLMNQQVFLLFAFVDFIMNTLVQCAVEFVQGVGAFSSPCAPVPDSSFAAGPDFAAGHPPSG